MGSRRPISSGALRSFAARRRQQIHSDVAVVECPSAHSRSIFESWPFLPPPSFTHLLTDTADESLASPELPRSFFEEARFLPQFYRPSTASVRKLRLTVLTHTHTHTHALSHRPSLTVSWARSLESSASAAGLPSPPTSAVPVQSKAVAQCSLARARTSVYGGGRGRSHSHFAGNHN